MAKKLIIDEGNTLIKAAIFNDDALVDTLSFNQGQLDVLAEFIIKHAPETAIISSVGAGEESLKQLVEKHCSVLMFHHSTPTALKILYKTPESLGLDRLAAAIEGNHQRDGFPILIIDAGSCITYDVVTAEGNYIGGAIGPGMSMRLKSLHHYTDRLPELEISDDFPLIGVDTQSCIRMGVQSAMIKEIEGMIDGFEKQYENLRVVITGGESSYFINQLKNRIFADPILVLKGLNRALEYNTH